MKRSILIVLMPLVALIFAVAVGLYKLANTSDGDPAPAPTALTAAPDGLSTITPPDNLDALLESKASVADPIAGYVRINPEGTAYLQWKAGWKLVSPTPKPSATPVDLTLTPDTPTPTIPPTSTLKPSATVTLYPTYTPLPTYTLYPTYTPGAGEASEDDPTPTIDTEPQPTPEPGEDKACLLRNLSGGPYNIRADHVATATIVGQVPTSEYATVVSVYVISDVTNEWFRVTYGNVTGWMLRSDDDLLFGADDTLDICLDATLTPTEYANNPLPSPAPTLAGPTPTAVPPIGVCTIFNFASFSKNVRETYSATSAVVFEIPAGASARVNRLYTKSSLEQWAGVVYTTSAGQQLGGWAAVKLGGTVIYELRGDCSTVPDGPGIARNTAGIHVLGGFQKTWDILAEIEHFGLLKITDDSLFLATEAKRINPSIIVIQRNVHLVSLGLRNCPDSWAAGDPIAVARNWWDVQVATWGARGLLGANSPIDYFEERNECIWAGQWEVAYQKEIIRLANQANICLALFSYFYGYPEPEQFAQLTPILDAVLAQECQPGKRHILAVHTYGNVSTGMYIWGRWGMLRNAVLAIDPKYAALEWVKTEFGLTNAQGNNDGRGSPDCARAALETRQAVDEYKKHPEVLGFGIYSFGGNTEWIDFTECLPMIAAALQ